jgi:hypothetical protein
MRRQRRADSISEAMGADPAVEVASDEAVTLIHEEIARLPQSLRLPIILCGLEGETREQAAQQLGCTDGMLKGRLERGRNTLLRRLRRRGLVVPAAAFSAMLAQQGVAQVPLALATSTVNAAMLAAAGQLLVGGAVSANALALSQGIVKAMLVTKLKIALVALCAGSVAIGSSVVMLRHLAAASPLVDQASVGTPADVAASDPKGNSDPEWKGLSDEEADEIASRNLKALMHAVHAYADDHRGKLPPAAVPNSDLPPNKRLSGFVVLLPYLGVRPSHLPENDPAWRKWHADADAARTLFNRIDLKKAWDDPNNAKAAKTVVRELVVPSRSRLRDQKGFAVSHFAFVRGYAGKDNGAFPLASGKEIAIGDITDGTSNTLAIGEIYSNLGPWIAAGPSTARFVFPVSAGDKNPSFGSQYKGCAHFANCDGFAYFLDMARTNERVLHFLAQRDDGQIVSGDDYYRYPTVSAWKKSRGRK